MAETIVSLLIENTVISAVLLAAVWFIKTVFKKQLTAQLQYLIWGVVVLKLLIPFSVTTQWSPYALIENASPSEPAAAQQVGMIGDNASNQPPQYTFDQTELVNQTVSTAQAVNTTESAKAASPDQKPSFLKPRQVDWMAVIVCVWLAGAAACGGWFLRKARQLKKKVYRCRAGDSPEWMLTVLEQSKTELGILRNIRVLVQGALPVPAIMGVFRPILMVPESLVLEKNFERTRHVFMHELMHSKRQDIMAIWLLNALCAVYWFNPLVWLSSRWIHRDMEAACDSMVVEKLGTAHRKYYIETILQFSGRNEFAHVKAAMSLNDGCMKLQQRIRSMYMRKTSRRVKATVIILTLMMLFAAFTSGCQPTPEKVIVQNKNNDIVAQAIAQSSEEANELHTYTAPETWQDEARDDAKNIDITIDADVVVPVDTWGLYELVPKSANKEDAQKMLKAIVGDTPIYGEETLLSKDQLIEEIAMYKARKAEFEEIYANKDVNEDGELAEQTAGDVASTPSLDRQDMINQLPKETIKENIEIFAQMIAEREAKLLNAPDEETVVEKKFNLDVMFDEDATSEQASAKGIILSNQADYRSAYVHGKADLGRETPASISIEYQTSSYGEYFNLNFVDYDDYEQGFFEGKDYTGQELFKCDIDVNDAAEMAREKVNELGYDYLDIAKTQVNALLDRKRKEGDDKFPECFEFIFTRELDGAVATYAHGDGRIVQEEEKEMEEAEYAPRWTASEVTVYVDDSGIIGIKTGATKSEVNRQAYGIELKDFSDIMDIFKQQVFIENAYSGPGDMNKVVNREIHVNEIRLGYMPMPWKDHAGKIIFAPVWDFFGNEKATFEEGIVGDLAEFLDENNAFAYDLGNQSLLTINALDGTIINRDY